MKFQVSSATIRVEKDGATFAWPAYMACPSDDPLVASLYNVVSYNISTDPAPVDITYEVISEDGVDVPVVRSGQSTFRAGDDVSGESQLVKDFCAVAFG